MNPFGRPPHHRRDRPGEGFELRSDAWVVVRSGQGLLLSTQERALAQSTIAECSEALSVLKGARDRVGRLDAAATLAGKSSMPVNGYFSVLVAALDPTAGDPALRRTAALRAFSVRLWIAAL